MTILFSGFRDDTLKSQIESKGGKVVSSFTKTVTHLIAKKDAKPSKKIDEAKERNVDILFLDDFLEEFEFKVGDKKPRAPKPAPPKGEHESDMALLCKVLVALSTGEGKSDAMTALDEIKARLSA